MLCTGHWPCSCLWQTELLALKLRYCLSVCVCVCVCLCVCVSLCVCVCLCVCVSLCERQRGYECVCGHACVCVYLCVSVITPVKLKGPPNGCWRHLYSETAFEAFPWEQINRSVSLELRTSGPIAAVLICAFDIVLRLTAKITSRRSRIRSKEFSVFQWY